MSSRRAKAFVLGLSKWQGLGLDPVKATGKGSARLRFSNQGMTGSVCCFREEIPPTRVQRIGVWGQVRAGADRFCGP